VATVLPPVRLALPLLLLTVLGCVDLSFPDVRLCDGGTCAGDGPRFELAPADRVEPEAGAEATEPDGSSEVGERDAEDSDTGEGDADDGTDAPLLEPGTACTSSAECLSGFCTDGVCCATACAGLCRSCKLAGKMGSCSEITDGQDPDAECADQGPTSCGTDGACNGLGACRRYTTGVVCGTASCNGSTETSSRICDGKGTCLPAAVRDCAPYQCGATACATSCATSATCKAPALCNAGSCGLRTNGAQCGSNGDCVSGVCAQGACCATACTGMCRSCNLAGTAGTCTNVPNGADPLNQCQDAGAASCGQDGQCNGAGGCRLYLAGTSCAAAICSAGSFNGPRSCSGTGSCTGPAGVSCGKYQCAAVSCRTTCSTGADCVSPSVCNGGACGGLKGEYFDAIDFTTFRFTRTDAVVNFNFPWDSRAGVGSPAANIAADTFSVRWTGTLTPTVGGSFTFFTRSDDRVRLILDGSVIINNVIDHEATEDSAQVLLVKDRAHAIQIDWAENTEAGIISLSWSSPGNGIAKQIVPTSVLQPAP
jgi:hypothetical protein